MKQQKMQFKNNSWYITSKKPFNSSRKFKKETIMKVFDFAYSMTFGENGEHRNHRSGGSIERKQGQIFADTFQGKLAECAISNLFYKIDPSTVPDFSVYKLGTWDSVDLNIKGKKIAIKSTKSFGNLLLLESKDWDQDGNYIPNLNSESECTYDYFILVRINPFCEEIMRKNRWLYSNDVDKENLKREILKNDWNYDCPGYITNDELIFSISNNHSVKKGDLLNGTTTFDASNYYIQAGDMNDISNLIKILEVL